MTERLSWNRGCFVETQCFHNVIVSAVTKMLGGVTMPWVSLSLIWACVSARKCYTLSVPTRGYLAEQGSHVVVYTQQRVEGCVVGTFGLINVTGWPLYENRAPVRLQFCVEPRYGCCACQHPWLWDWLWLERAGNAFVWVCQLYCVPQGGHIPVWDQHHDGRGLCLCYSWLAHHTCWPQWRHTCLTRSSITNSVITILSKHLAGGLLAEKRVCNIDFLYFSVL